MSERARALFEYCELIGILKHTHRRGWVLIGIPNPESVLSHSARMAQIACLLEPIKDCDMNRVIQMCLFHDNAECRIGDITPSDCVPPEVKKDIEEKAMVELANLLTERKKKWHLELFHEYEARQTIESRVAKELDIMDFLLQTFSYEVLIYEKHGELLRTQQFFDNSKKEFEFDEIRELYELLNMQRAKFYESIGAKPCNGPRAAEGDHKTFSQHNLLKSNGYDQVIPKKAMK